MASLDEVFPGLKDKMIKSKETYEKRSTCPICSEHVVRACDCFYNDSECKNGHKWYFENDKIKLGSGHDKYDKMNKNKNMKDIINEYINQN